MSTLQSTLMYVPLQRVLFTSHRLQQTQEVIYQVVNDECEVINRFNRPFKPFGVPDEAEYRGNTYIGAGRPLQVFSDGVAVEVYSTPRNEDDPDGIIYCPHIITIDVYYLAPHYIGTWAVLESGHCIPVTEAFYKAYGRFGTDDVYTGHLT